MHCKSNSVYIFLFWELRGLSPNFYIHVSVSDLYIPRMGPHSSSSRNGSSILGIYNSLTDTWMWKLGLRPRYSFSGNICFKFSAFFLCSVTSFPARSQKSISFIKNPLSKIHITFKGTVQRELRWVKIGINRTARINWIAGKCHFPCPKGPSREYHKCTWRL